MATTTWRILGTTSVEPGKDKHWYWNNALLTSVYAFNVSPFKNEFGTVEIEVTRVWRTYNSDSNESEVHFRFKNTGSSSAFAYVFMSEIAGP
jgi:hypothetical protein